MIKEFNANKARQRRHARVRRRVTGTPTRPRLSVFRSGQHVYAQIIDDAVGRTLVAASSLEPELRVAPSATPKAEQPSKAEAAPAKASSTAAKSEAPKGKAKGEAAKAKAPEPTEPESDVARGIKGIEDNHKVAQARIVGRAIAERALAQGIKQVVFDRGGYIYHGRVAALATGAREGGLDF